MFSVDDAYVTNDTFGVKRYNMRSLSDLARRYGEDTVESTKDDIISEFQEYTKSLPFKDWRLASIEALEDSIEFKIVYTQSLVADEFKLALRNKWEGCVILVKKKYDLVTIPISKRVWMNYKSKAPSTWTKWDTFAVLAFIVMMMTVLYIQTKNNPERYGWIDFIFGSYNTEDYSTDHIINLYRKAQ